MTFRFIFTLVLICCMQNVFSAESNMGSDSLILNTNGLIDTDSVLEKLQPQNKTVSKKPQLKITDTDSLQRKGKSLKGIHALRSNIHSFDSLVNVNKTKIDVTGYVFTLPEDAKPICIDTLILKSNPLFIDLVYQAKPLNFNWNLQSDFRKLYYSKEPNSLNVNAFIPIEETSVENFITELRLKAKDEITLKVPELYKFRYDELPDPNQNKNELIERKKITKVQFVDDNASGSPENKKIVIQKAILNPWSHESSALVQFSENYVSENWYQGGNSNLAVLGILMGKLNYDNKNNIQWDNFGEWRTGFNSENTDALRKFSVNNDLFRINSKLGVRAGGKWFYSGSVEFSTQFFNSYKSVSSSDMKTTFLTPVRVNIGVGLDYKYLKILSIMFSPVSYKYIYLNEKDETKINPNLFGIKNGDHILSEMGSSFRVVYAFAPTREIQLDSKLLFYTNYQKVEIDWEVVCNFTINRFMSTRISFNPRYDNTVIEKNGDKAKIQFKQLLSIGFSHKFK